ncbi:MAG TPA: NADH-quinone oxidoreductase subunit L [Desulfobaccales bacterium]
MEAVLLLLLLLPLSGAVINAVSGRFLPRRAVETVACAAVLGAFAAATVGLILSGDKAHDLTFWQWFGAGRFSTAMNVHFDPLAAVMAMMVTFVAGIIHLYSAAFMREDTDYVRYFCYLNLFVFAMLVITVADSLIFVYLGWEGVGFCSYALIGFWYRDEANANAGRKAFICTRIGDIAFGVALALFFVHFGNFSISYIIGHAAGLSPTLITVLALLLLGAAVGKSAQLPLTVWLPDAMAGPTPVSALIHAATMVTAGTYLLMRLFPLVSLSPTAMLVIAAIGSVTALYASFAALAQWDLKKMLAYSTISQVGYMFLAVGAGDIVGGLFHLVSHAFFKSLLFLAAGIVIQALEEEHNIFRMGNLRRLMPAVYWLFLIGAISLSAFPLLGGFFSKDRILLAAFINPDNTYKIFWFLGLVAAFLTPLYTFRVFFVAFPERPGGRQATEIRPTPRFMAWVLWPLAICALGDGLLNLPGGFGKNFLGHFLAIVPGARPDLGATAATEWGLGFTNGSIVIISIILAYVLYRRRPVREPALEGYWGFLFSGFYLDRLYQLIFVRPYEAVAPFLWRQVDDRYDRGIVRGARLIFRPYRALAEFFWLKVDELVINNGAVKAAGSLMATSRGLGYWTTGRLSTYLKMLLLGLTIFFGAVGLSWYLQ